MTQRFDSLGAAVDVLLARIPGPIVLGLPLGIGKPNPFVNALYRRIKADPTRRLAIVTALSLEKPSGKSELEQAFLAPLVERVFRDYPDFDYVKDLRGPGLPPNIEVREFFMKTGDYLHNTAAQQHYISTNYTFAARDLVGQGINVVAQAVAERWQDGVQQFSLSSNPDLTAELVERCAAAGRPLLKIAVINRQMPFMEGEAVVAPDFFDAVVDCPEGTHTLFAPPNGKISTTDYAIGLHASSLVQDGGTLQIGIGSLGDAIAQALILRDQQGETYRQMLATLCPDGLGNRELGRFAEGLYGCSEMFVNGLLQLMQAGIVRRRVFDDLATQLAVNEGKLDPATLPGGVCMTGGFFLGPGSFYQALRDLTPEQRAQIDMTRIDAINRLDAHGGAAMDLKRAQRRKAAFMNTTMKVTLLGAAASDALEDGRVVSGVGGQYNFVAMAHALPDARSILMLRATKETADGPVSNIVYRYGHCTIPRHLRDVVITEYGVAELRGCSDAEIVKRLLAITDSRFQDELIKEAKQHGKLEDDWQLPERYRHNTPQELDAKLHPFTEQGLLPGFPFGTDLTPDELKIVAALRRLKKATQNPVELVKLAMKAFWEGKEAPPAYLERLGLDEAQGFKAMFIRKLFAGNL
ncbi:acetyl-CoA hydrolase/transferase C-terminal domain-containing protein [Inhella proteolytica]|uniref:Acetyl-CoA hydrolase n=1 Tax=Inhella proteolytica TaxID=2795029 RepID=A0A931J6N2_9BURK|nr:acetyl-CoA hydrolase/transferase C-terminal domain-containing protein [Inhella proteolytica]MBH9579220.1 acetyl-CoA hydrolase [Inhella proteolytica]